MPFKCYLVDGDARYAPTVGTVFRYSPEELSPRPYVGDSDIQANNILKQISDSWVLGGNFSDSIQDQSEALVSESQENLAHFSLESFGSGG